MLILIGNSFYHWPFNPAVYNLNWKKCPQIDQRMILRFRQKRPLERTDRCIFTGQGDIGKVGVSFEVSKCNIDIALKVMPLKMNLIRHYGEYTEKILDDDDGLKGIRKTFHFWTLESIQL